MELSPEGQSPRVQPGSSPPVPVAPRVPRCPPCWRLRTSQSPRARRSSRSGVAPCAAHPPPWRHRQRAGLGEGKALAGGKQGTRALSPRAGGPASHTCPHHQLRLAGDLPGQVLGCAGVDAAVGLGGAQHHQRALVVLIYEAQMAALLQQLPILGVAGASGGCRPIPEQLPPPLPRGWGMGRIPHHRG